MLWDHLCIWHRVRWVYTDSAQRSWTLADNQHYWLQEGWGLCLWQHVPMCLGHSEEADSCSPCNKGERDKIKFVDVQKQSGGYDCGLFAIAFATSLVYGVQPGNVRYDQPKMRKHLCQCLEEERIRPFPALKTKRTPRADITTTDSIEVYCSCRMPEVSGIEMVQCNGCEDWFHVHCVSVSRQALEVTSLDWLCKACI